MKTGFYSLSNLSNSELKALFTDAIMEAHLIACESKGTVKNPIGRSIDTKYSIKGLLETVSTKNHNVFIDRSVQFPYEIEKLLHYGEIGWIYDDPDWHQITINVTKERLEKLAKKYNLKEMA